MCLAEPYDGPHNKGHQRTNGKKISAQHMT